MSVFTIAVVDHRGQFISNDSTYRIEILCKIAIERTKNIQQTYQIDQSWLVGTDGKHGKKLQKTRLTLKKNQEKHGKNTASNNHILMLKNQKLGLLACRVESHHHVKC